MWPGQQPPGGEQNPQDPNTPQPYRQPGYQQPNPYQQPGIPGQPPAQPGRPPQPEYGSPNPYQQPTVPQYAVPGHQPGAPTPPPGKDGGDRRTTAVVASAAAFAVLVTAGVTGYLVLGDDGGKTTANDGPKPSQSSSASADPSTAPPVVDNPRGGDKAAKPTVSGWKVVYNPKWGTVFDVPGDWEVKGSGWIIGLEDEKKGDGSLLQGMGMSSPAYFKSEWCTYDDDKDGKEDSWELATTGTKGAQGAKNTEEAARIAAGSWVWAAYAQSEPQENIKISKAEAYTSTSGLEGHVATASADGLKHPHKCATDGKSIAFAFKNAKGDFSTWVLYAPKGVKDEVPDATIKKILSTVRLAEASGEAS
ncbi:hypothetical protein I3F58_15665 [Streptomyces sp. MUM 203J]|uniref:hypothetical protein n=1 Tax=Streptomyces sp. MUM 203J TaxID=2791990 RepID=UPI001F049BC0|nr:hypothetical protein [Streptomyces sp. MUM 203J]MCH0540981.1 hypothetical protein [Streptomyces sp. MUM 203J]